MVPAAAAAAVVALVVLALRPSASPADEYAQQVRSICHAAESSLHGSRGNYWDSVALVSRQKRDALSRLHPPAARRALHEQLLAGEGDLLAAATATPLEQFQRMRAKQAELESRYRTLGIKGCSD